MYALFSSKTKDIKQLQNLSDFSTIVFAFKNFLTSQYAHGLHTHLLFWM